MVPREWTGPRTMGPLGNSVELFHLPVGTHPSLNGYKIRRFSLDIICCVVLKARNLKCPEGTAYFYSNLLKA